MGALVLLLGGFDVISVSRVAAHSVAQLRGVRLL
jgi:hypothetical protein